MRPVFGTPAAFVTCVVTIVPQTIVAEVPKPRPGEPGFVTVKSLVLVKGAGVHCAKHPKSRSGN